MEAGVAAIKIEGRQRSPAYVAQVTRVWRDAIDSARRNPAGFRARARLAPGPARCLGGRPDHPGGLRPPLGLSWPHLYQPRCEPIQIREA